jgi:hypothetical protein
MTDKPLNPYIKNPKYLDQDEVNRALSHFKEAPEDQGEGETKVPKELASLPSWYSMDAEALGATAKKKVKAANEPITLGEIKKEKEAEELKRKGEKSNIGTEFTGFGGRKK